MLVIALLVACAVPPSCERMCHTSGEVWSDCADSEPLGWDATPFKGRPDHDEWCDTWVWEQRQLDDQLEETCRSRDNDLADASCDGLL